MDGIANGCVRFCSHLRDVLLLFTMFVVSAPHESSSNSECVLCSGQNARVGLHDPVVVRLQTFRAIER